VHGEAVFVFFSIIVDLHQVLGQPFTGALSLGTICKSAVYGQRAIDR